MKENNKISNEDHKKSEIPKPLRLSLWVLRVFFLGIALYWEEIKIDPWLYLRWREIREAPSLELLKILGAALLASVGYYFSYRRSAELARQNDETASNNLAQRRQSSLQSAIEHLGNNSQGVRIGAIHELNQLVKKDNEQLETVQEILCSYIRMRSTEKEYIADYHQTKEEPDVFKVAEEIQTALNLLVKEGGSFESHKINLEGAHLEGPNLNEAHLVGAHLKEADLLKAHLKEADLEEADLEGANLEGAFFRYPDGDQDIEQWEKENARYWEGEGWEAVPAIRNKKPIKVLQQK